VSTQVPDALADTSIFIAAEAGRSFEAAPDGDVLISAATLTELGVGVLLAPDAVTRRRRTSTLRSTDRFIPLSYDERVAARLAEIVSALRSARRRVNLFDAIIAATAVAHGLTIWTQDGDFEVIEEVAGGPPVLRA
jgi:predicted nucleic acid-binding protein